MSASSSSYNFIRGRDRICVDLSFFVVYTLCMTRREFLGLGTAGLAAVAALTVTPFKVRFVGHRLVVHGPLHRVCRVRINGQQVKPLQTGLLSSSFDIQKQLAGLDGPGMINVSAPLTPFKWTMKIHPFEAGF